MEAHPYLEEDTEQFEGNLASVVETLIDITGERGYRVDWDLVKTVIAESNGIPAEIGVVIEGDPEGLEKQEIASVQ